LGIHRGAAKDGSPPRRTCALGLPSLAFRRAPKLFPEGGEEEGPHYRHRLAWRVGLGADGRVERARLALGSVAPTVIRPKEVEEALVGRPVSPEAWEDLVPRLSAATQPISDLRASADYRRTVAGRLLLALAEELARRG